MLPSLMIEQKQTFTRQKHINFTYSSQPDHTFEYMLLNANLEKKLPSMSSHMNIYVQIKAIIFSIDKNATSVKYNRTKIYTNYTTGPNTPQPDQKPKTCSESRGNYGFVFLEKSLFNPNLATHIDTLFCVYDNGLVQNKMSVYM